MITMSKEEISNYLCYYAHFQELFVKRRHMSLLESYKWFNKANNVVDANFLNEMIRTYNFYVNFRMYSIEEDFFLNRDNNISNEDLDTFVHNCTFYDKPNNITNKRLLEIVRNAFNHSLDSSLKVSKNCKNFELDIPDIRYPRQIARGGNPERLHMRFNINYIYDLNNLISDKGRNVLYTWFDIQKDFDIEAKHLYTELDKIKFLHYYFDRKLEPNVMQDFKDLNRKVANCEGDQNEIHNQINTLANSINPPTTYDLTHDQKMAAIELIKKYRPYLNDWSKNKTNHFMFNVLNFITPVPGLKLSALNFELWYLHLITSNKDFSFDKTILEVIDSMEDTTKISTMPLRDKMDFCTYLLTNEFVINMPYMIYIDSVITNLCDEDYIQIDGKKYEVRELRNSLVHARWYIGNNKVYFFDGLPENKNDYNLKLVGCIDLNNLIKWTDNYLIEKNKQNNFVYSLKK